MNTETKSKCCGESITQHGYHAYGRAYICTKCGQATDPATEQPSCANPQYCELAALRLENAALKNQLTSHLCSHHQTPDPLNCKMCNTVNWLTNANSQRAEMIELLQLRIKELEKEANAHNAENTKLIEELRVLRERVRELEAGTGRRTSFWYGYLDV